MSFFEPMPPQPERRHIGPYGPTWAPPAWDRPSEGIAPALVAVNRVVARNENTALYLKSLSVYPNGLTLDLVVMGSPRRPMDEHRMHPFIDPGRWPRIGVEYADGRRAGHQAPRFISPMEIAKDEQGLPLEPILMPGGGGGSNTHWDMSLWLFPLPTGGPLRIHAMWPEAGVEDTVIEIDGSVIEAAAEQAVVLWE